MRLRPQALCSNSDSVSSCVILGRILYASVFSSVQGGQYWWLPSEAPTEGMCVITGKSTSVPSGRCGPVCSSMTFDLLYAVPSGGEDILAAAACLCGVLGVKCTSSGSGCLCCRHKKR